MSTIDTALKMNSAIEKKSVKESILSLPKEVLGDDFGSLPIKEQKEILSFTGMSSKAFAAEWNSEEDDKAFAHLQES